MPRYTMGFGPPAVTPGTWCPGGGAKRSDGKLDSALLHIVDIFHREFSRKQGELWHLPRHTGNCVTDAVRVTTTWTLTTATYRFPPVSFYRYRYSNSRRAGPLIVLAPPGRIKRVHDERAAD